MQQIAKIKMKSKLSWTQQLEILFKIYKDTATQNKGASSKLAFARFLGISQGKMQAWEKGQRPSADDLENISYKLNISPLWLLQREGDPFPSVNISSYIPSFILSAPNPETGWSTLTACPPSEICPNDMGGESFMLRVQCDNLSPFGIHVGSTLFCDPATSCKLGDIVIVQGERGCMACQYITETKEIITVRQWLFLAFPTPTYHPQIQTLSTHETSSITPIVYIRRHA